MSTRKYNKEQTKQRLIDAVGRVLSHRGFSAVGVNAVAAEAEVDKALIYRYFGGFPQLLEAYANGESFWPSLEDFLGDQAYFQKQPFEKKFFLVFQNYLRELKKRPLTLEILAWEILSRNEVTASLEEVREKRGQALLSLALNDTEEINVDLEAITAIFSAALHYLLLRSRHINLFVGIKLKTKEGWQRIENAMCSLIEGVLSKK